MSWLVKEIQKDILNDKEISTILRKSLVLGKKLNRKIFYNFIKKESDWYWKNDKIPKYRYIQWHTVMSYNRFHWWQTVTILNIDIFNKLTESTMYEPISTIEKLSRSESWLERILPTWVMYKLTWIMTEYKTCFTNIVFHQIIEKVKNRILEECLELEDAGIHWEWISFSKEEIEKASTITNNFYWDLNNTQLQQNNDNSEQTYTNNINNEDIKKFITELEESLNSTSQKNVNHKEILKQSSKIKEELWKSSPKANIIKESLMSIRSIAEWVTWNLLFQWIISNIDKII